jgi:ketosteroid isomerase-like protein
MNTEHASGKLKSGGPVDWDLISTNVFEKIEGRWLMVSHHAMAPMK